MAWLDGSEIGSYIQKVGSYVSTVTIPLNEYQLGNLVDALSQADHNGDWYGEFLQRVECAMERLGLSELTSNRGRTFTLDQIRNYDIR
ncbi:MAG: hypothetical protein KGL39_44965 [Patescibacteria group bacterium]|nr:hypothetical protein [Patescibacteria group bacterium]